MGFITMYLCAARQLRDRKWDTDLDRKGSGWAASGCARDFQVVEGELPLFEWILRL
jgi:hypothetical protein